MRAQRLLCVVASLGAFISVSAAPNPMPTPLPEEKRQLSTLLGGLTSLAFTVITEAGHDAFTVATGAGGVVTSIAGSVFTAATVACGSVAGKVFTDITSLGGHEYTVVSDQAGHIATLAVSGAGVVTPVGASVYTAATSLPTNTVGSQSVARLATSAPWLPAPIIIALGSVAAGAMLSAGFELPAEWVHSTTVRAIGP